MCMQKVAHLTIQLNISTLLKHHKLITQEANKHIIHGKRTCTKQHLMCLLKTLVRVRENNEDPNWTSNSIRLKKKSSVRTTGGI